MNARVAEPQAEPGDRAPVQAVLDALKLTAAQWQTHRVTCPAGGALWTVEADTARDSAPPALPGTLHPSGGAVLDKPDLLAFRSGPAGVTVRINAGAVTVTSTTGC